MYKHSLSVFGEDLAQADLTKTQKTSNNVFVGGSNGALIINVMADTAVTISGGSGTVSIKHCDTKSGEFAEIASLKISDGDYAKGDIMATYSLPKDVKDWVQADTTLTGTGNVIVTPAYLAR